MDQVHRKKKSPTDRDLLRIATFILFDAVVFHEVLSGVSPAVRSLRKSTQPYQTFLEAEWEKILKVDYAPVFGIAYQVLQSFPTSPNTEALIKEIIDTALSIIASGILLKHDFMGRLYHKLLLRTTGHYYATYYTSIPAAWLLANLIFKTPHPSWSFSELNRIGRFRILDPACGSGTLLSAAYMAVRDLYIRTMPVKLDLAKLHNILLEKVIHGWDILEYAAHLTLTTLALHYNRSTINKSSVFVIPCGVSHTGIVRLGSLDKLRAQTTFLGRGFTQTTTKKTLEGIREQEIPDQDYDVVIMNPPFSRSAKPNVKFGYSDPKSKTLMEKELRTLGAEIGASGIGQAGLGAYFMLLGLKLLKEDGRIGVVIPRAMLSGVSWAIIRDKYLEQCEIEYVVSNYDPGDKEKGIDPWCWSENTDLGEVLIIARKCSRPKRDNRVIFINLWNKPRNEIEALLISQQVIREKGKLTRNIQNDEWHNVVLKDKQIGAIYQVPQEILQRNWLLPCVFSSPQLNAFNLNLVSKKSVFVEFGALTNKLGIDIKQVKDNFEKSDMATANRLVWGHQAVMNTILLSPIHVGYGQPKHGQKSVLLHTRGASTILVAERPHLSTECLLAMKSPLPVLTTAFWEVNLKEPSWEHCLLLWLNSTYCFMQFLGCSTSSMGDIFKMKKEQLYHMPVIDPSSIPLTTAKLFFESIQRIVFLPYGEEFALAAQKGGSRFNIDKFFSENLELPSIPPEIYRLLASDPIVSKSRL